MRRRGRRKNAPRVSGRDALRETGRLYLGPGADHPTVGSQPKTERAAEPTAIPVAPGPGPGVASRLATLERPPNPLG